MSRDTSARDEAGRGRGCCGSCAEDQCRRWLAVYTTRRIGKATPKDPCKGRGGWSAVTSCGRFSYGHDSGWGWGISVGNGWVPLSLPLANTKRKSDQKGEGGGRRKGRRGTAIEEEREDQRQLVCVMGG